MLQTGIAGGLLLIVTSVLFSSEPGRGVRSGAFADASSALPPSAWSPYHNPAQLGYLHSVQSAAWLVPQQYGLAELRVAAVSAAVPLGNVAIGGSAERFGFDLYNESLAQIAIGALVADAVAVGATLTGKYLAIRNYGSRWVPLITTGFLVNPSGEIRVAGVVRNVHGARIGNRGERLPQSISLGMSWSSGGFLTTVDFEKDIRFPAQARIGVERKLLDAVSFRAGVGSGPRLLCAGMAVRVAGIECGFASRYHSALGWTHQFEAGVEVAS